MNSFGSILRIFRQRSNDPQINGHRLTQERLGQLLGEELGIVSYSGAAVSDWERGQSKINADDRLVLVSLLKILYVWGGFTNRSEANELLEAGNYRALDNAEIQTVFQTALVKDKDALIHPTPKDGSDQSQSPIATAPPTLLWPPGIPDEPYHPLPGQEKMLREIELLMKDKQGPRAISIDGLGGNGKTALAAELSRRMVQTGLYQGVIGDTAKQEIFAGGEIVQLEAATLNYEGLLNALARQLQLWEVFALDPKGKEAALTKTLRSNQYLVLIDNLETAENANALVARFISTLGASRAILTSRPRIHNAAVHSVSLDGLGPDDSLAFLRWEAKRIEARQILEAENKTLREIHEISGGSPLAMKLVAAQTKFLELDYVLRQLRKASGKLFPFIFRQSWGQLAPGAQSVLIYIGRTVFETVSAHELLVAELVPGDDDLIMAIEQLNAYSLLNISPADGQIRYGIHPLTRQFVISDLPQMWRDQGLL